MEIFFLRAIFGFFSLVFSFWVSSSSPISGTATGMSILSLCGIGLFIYGPNEMLFGAFTGSGWMLLNFYVDRFVPSGASVSIE